MNTKPQSLTPSPRPSSDIDILIHSTAEKYKLPYELLYAQVKQESAFDPLAVSRCGARGLMQLMPATGREMGLSENDFFDAGKNLNAGAGYFRRMHRAVTLFVTTLPSYAKHLVDCNEEDFWKFALASYNGGLGYIFKAFNLCIADNQNINWQNVRNLLDDVRLKVKGRVLDPDDKQMIGYVEKIWSDFKNMDSRLRGNDGSKEVSHGHSSVV